MNKTNDREASALTHLDLWRDGHIADEILKTLPCFMKGSVWLAGAGTGDVGLLTLYVLRGLQEADVIVYDALVSDEILALLPKKTKKVFAGKREGKPSWKQSDISNLLITEARAHKKILRLKGGDPFTFARGAEEAEALVQAGIPFRVVPGITAGIGGLEYAGIPITHRDINHAVSFITGHLADGCEVELLDWNALAKGSPILVIYMGLKKLPAIVGKLIGAGLSLATPLAIISRATLPSQQVLETSLGQVLKDIAHAPPPTPCIIVVGETVSLRASLDWLGALGGKILKTQCQTYKTSRLMSL